MKLMSALDDEDQKKEPLFTADYESREIAPEEEELKLPSMVKPDSFTERYCQ